ncbi:intraflagellar transport protein 43 homolog isoform X1 [Octopus sinensis]|uniref:Intraflagellar transport protein 43 homolog isoform X1 n=1 Tax=Octopus sinensis TaxID=2607531 RepID=A0A7E6F728_9MOLL|nr:intraflagellar transport protein 43 homolog isoform X1 [Octopus sinensis]
MEDLDIGEAKARIAKQGRRAAKSSQPNESQEEPVVEVKARVSGWVEDSNKNRKSKNSSNILEDKSVLSTCERLRPKNILEEEESDSDVAAIPELEDQPDEDLIPQVADAPMVQISKVLTYRELDNDLKQAAFPSLDNEVDLKMLTRCLLPESDLIEEDKPWNWEQLFTEVSSEIANIKDKNSSSPITELL